tara:strand:+ start:118 stop:483 length:366 start_codon:yes stop_codon:yes gene_type:complete
MKITRKRLQEMIAEQLEFGNLNKSDFSPNFIVGKLGDKTSPDIQDISAGERKYTDNQLIDMILESLRCPKSGLKALSKNPFLVTEFHAPDEIAIYHEIYDPNAGETGEMGLVTEMRLKILK